MTFVVAVVPAVTAGIAAGVGLNQLFSHWNKEQGRLKATKHVSKETWALEISWIGANSAWDITADGKLLADRIDAESEAVSTRRVARNVPIVITWRRSNHWWNRRHKTTFSAVSDIPKAPPIIVHSGTGLSF